jgi:hypothetical protein
MVNPMMTSTQAAAQDLPDRAEAAGAGTLDRVILVDEGDSGIGVLLLGFLKKAVSREECALCEIAHRPVGKRDAWRKFAARLGVVVDELHRDELRAGWGISRDELPCILSRRGSDVPRILVSREEVVSCRATLKCSKASSWRACQQRRGVDDERQARRDGTARRRSMVRARGRWKHL